MGEAVNEFLNMGGYARFVWPAYGLTAAVLIANVVLPMVHRQRMRERIARKAKLAEPRP
jgi:heme exporter protein D